jgi:hypothetical protein
MQTAGAFNQSGEALHCRSQQPLMFNPTAQMVLHHVKYISADAADLSRHHRFVCVNQPAPNQMAQEKSI